MAEQPVGVFDSGVGGLSVLREIRQLLPQESLLYVSDSGHAPYGEKSQQHIRERSLVIADFLLQQGAKALVLACNTATAAAVTDLRGHYPQLPIIGMEPAVKPAAAATRSGTVGVLATTGTLKSAKFAALLDRFASDIEVITQPCPGLVELIETGNLQSPALLQLLSSYVAPLLSKGCDTLILGCTHYPFLKPLLRQMLPASIAIIDTGAAVARQLQRLLETHQLLAQDTTATAQFWCSGDASAMQKIMPNMWGESVIVRTLAQS